MKKGQACWIVNETDVIECIYQGSSGKPDERKVENLATGELYLRNAGAIFENEQDAEAFSARARAVIEEKKMYEREQRQRARRGQLTKLLEVDREKNVLERALPEERGRRWGFHPMLGDFPLGGSESSATVGLRELGKLIADSKAADEYADRHKKLIELILLFDDELGAEKVDELLGRVLT